MNPQELGAQIGTCYQQAMHALAPLLEADTLDTEAVQALHTRTVEALVALGAEREKLDEEARAEVDDAATEQVFELDSDVYATFLEKQRNIEDRSLQSLVSSFGIITQYAFYELLRLQRPDEAARLGIA